MSPVLPRLLPVCALALGALNPRGASAQETIPGLPPVPSMDSEEREGTPRPAPPDERTGHVYVRAVSGLLLPAGFVRTSAAITDVASFGVGVGGAVGVGVSRHAELDATGMFGLFASPPECANCSADMVAAGVGVTYHLAQGVSLDPWARLGVGYRTASLTIEDPAPREPSSGRYHGVDFLQISLGATYLPVSGFGLGPYAQADVGTFVARPAPDPGGTRVYAVFHLGLRFEIDPIRWTDPTPTPTAAQSFFRPAPPSL